MQTTINGCYEMTGIGKESKAPYSIFRLLVSVRAQGFETPACTRKCWGNHNVEVECTPESVAQFKSLTYPWTGNVLIDQKESGGKMISIYAGVMPMQKQA